MAAPSHLGAKLAAGYTALCLAAGAYAFWSPGAMELSGVLLVLLGFPWSLMGVMAVVAAQGTSAVLFAGVVVVGCAINAWLLSRIGRRSVRVSSHGNA
jgi:hypothetical protein